MSRATRPMQSVDLDRLLMDARTHNAEKDVTGVLLYGAGQFFQYFEGHPADVEDVYERIRRSGLHHELVELERRRVPQRLFHKWFMGFRDAPASVIQKLSQQQWMHEIPWAEDHSAASPGMQQLMAFLASGSTDDA
ncbi:BLUF domain-containing protein [Rhodanobacter sp. BL-MT-08]